MIETYPTFDEVLNPTLRVWNRVNTLFNIKQLVGNGVATKYAEQFNKEDRVAILIMANYIKLNGYENTRREIMKGERPV